MTRIVAHPARDILFVGVLLAPLALAAATPVRAADASATQAPSPGATAGASSGTAPGQPPGGGQPPGPPPGGGQPPGGLGGSGTVTNGTSATTIDTDSTISGTTYTSTGDDENALRIDGATVTLDGVTVNKTAGASTSTENGDFYGQNAGLLVLDGATATITDSTFTTSATNGNAVFSYGEGTIVDISDSVIRTTGDDSGGIQTTGGGTTNAANLDVETQGDSAAAIRSDRGGGTVTVTGGTYITDGLGSPAIYSTADISVIGATLTAHHSEGVVVEGKNSVSLVDSDLSGDMTAQADSDNVQAVMIYQSMSGDADVGQASFTMTGGSLTALSGDLFYVTNTTAAISLTDVDLTTANGTLVRISGNTSSRGWGTAGANGADVVLTASQQTMDGTIIVDGISSLDLTLADGSAFTGAVNPDGAAGDVAVTLDGTSTWTLTADSYVSSFSGDLASVDASGYHLYVAGAAVN